MQMRMPTGSNFSSHSDQYDVDGENDLENIIEIEPTFEDVFEEYLWMEDEEEFDKNEMQRLEEEALMEQCVEAMLEDELESRVNYTESFQDTIDQVHEVCQAMLSFNIDSENFVESSLLNPLAAEFIPTKLTTSPSPST